MHGQGPAGELAGQGLKLTDQGRNIELKLDKAAFETEVTELAPDQWSETGAERVAFLVSTNPATPPGPIERVASGGELALVMLALKVTVETARPGRGSPPKSAQRTLIFDEIDGGIPQ